MHSVNSPHVTGAPARELAFSSEDPAYHRELDLQPPGSPPDDLPAPRAARRHVPPPPLENYPDMGVITPSRESRAWLLPTGENSGFNTLVDTADDVELVTEMMGVDSTCSLSFHGALVGVIATRRPTHVCDYPHGYASTTVRCLGCRWFETRVFRLDDHDSSRLNGARYVLHYVGRSIIPGEVNLPRHELVTGAHEVVEAYTVRRHNEQPFITKPGARVLAQAANYDVDIEDAYINRATA